VRPPEENLVKIERDADGRTRVLLTFIKGRCPACDADGSIFVGVGGYLTCSRLDCPEPDAPHKALGGAR
jgi:hypothetical protein